MGKESIKSDKLESNFLTILAVIGSIAVVCIIVALYYYIRQFDGSLSPMQTDWGVFGDYFGGVLNPILGFLSLIAILLALVFQRRELKLSTHELKQSSKALQQQSESLKLQNFERTFFELINLTNTIINDMDLVRTIPHSDGATATIARGRDCFKTFHSRLKEASSVRTRISDDVEFIIESYSAFLEKTEHDIEPYFKTLYQTLKFLDNSTIKNKDQYAEFIRAQLSSYQIAILFYDAIHPTGNQFKDLVEKYHLVKALNVKLLLNKEHLQFYNRDAFGGRNILLD